MKKVIVFFIALAWGLVANAQPFFEKDVFSNPERELYLETRYAMSHDQIVAYSTAVDQMHVTLLELYTRHFTTAEWKMEYKSVCDAFLSAVDDIMTPEQYNQWSIDNRGQQTIRRYRENLQLDDEKLNQLLQIIDSSKKALRGLVQERVTYLERSSRQKDIYSKRNDDLFSLLGEDAGKKLAKALDEEDKASFVRGHMPEFTRRQSYDMGRLYMNFTYSVFEADWSDWSPAIKKEKKHAAYLDFLSKMKSYLTPEEYDIWSNRHFSYHDNRICHDMNMTEKQFEVYKDIMNNRAVERFMIAKRGVKGEAKQAVFDQIDVRIKAEISERISPDAAEMWYNNLTKEN